MRLRIEHETRYLYNKNVVLNPHHIFLKPLQRNYVHIEKYQVNFSPEPAGLNERYDVEDNPYWQAWFTGFTDRLLIHVDIELTTSSFNPFLFLVDPWFLAHIDRNNALPFCYQTEDSHLLRPYLHTDDESALSEYARSLLQNPDPITFLNTLTTAIYSDWKHIIREEESLWEPASTFLKQQGSCRDLSWMFIHMLRSLGLAARFVSGYAFNPELEAGHELHAWVEVYLPGAGWTGLDPNLGLFTDEHYIPLASSYHPSRTLPVHGSYGGKGLEKAQLTTQVEISRL